MRVDAGLPGESRGRVWFITLQPVSTGHSDDKQPTLVYPCYDKILKSKLRKDVLGLQFEGGSITAGPTWQHEPEEAASYHRSRDVRAVMLDLLFPLSSGLSSGAPLRGDAAHTQDCSPPFQ